MCTELFPGLAEAPPWITPFLGTFHGHCDNGHFPCEFGHRPCTPSIEPGSYKVVERLPRENVALRVQYIILAVISSLFMLSSFHTH